MVRYRANPAMATTPFDKNDSIEAVWIHDDFLGVADTSDATDAAGVSLYTATGVWNLSEVAGDSAAAADRVAGVADHPGILQITTGATTAADGDVVALCLGPGAGNDADGDILLDSNGVYLATVINIADVDAQKVEFGLAGQAPAAVNSSAADIVSFVWDPEDAENVGDELFICQVNGGGSDVEEVASAVPYVEGDWVLLEIAADDTSATFRITTEDNTQTITLDGSDSITVPTVAMRPFFSCEAVGGAEELLKIDAFHLRYLRRTEPWASSGYLGA